MKMKNKSGKSGLILLALLLFMMMPIKSVFAGEDHIVKVKDFNFHPADLIIHEGDTVLWINEMPYGHWVISGSDIRHDNRFFSPLLLDGHKFSYTFKEAVVQDYYCPIHSMQGSITVLKGGKEDEEEKTLETDKQKRRRRSRD